MYDVAIAGGGLAGCGAAILLAEQGLRVCLVEKQRLPAHKLCGEFLSVEVAACFDRLGVLARVLDAGAHPIRRARLTAMGRQVFETNLPGTALGLSRFVLDRLLFERAREAGADVRDGTAVQAIRGTLADGFSVDVGSTVLSARAVLGAYGKRGTLDRKLEREAFTRRSPYVAFKAHYEGRDLSGVIEVHAFPGGYCGLSRIEGGRVNACWIARTDALVAGGGTPDGMVTSVLRRNPALDRHFGGSVRVSDRFLAVSQIDLMPKGCFAGDVCLIGDAAGMIAPVCGDGMAMALRSAELAAPWVVGFLQGTTSPAAFKRGYERAWRRAFTQRMRLGRWIHRAACLPGPAAAGIRVCVTVPALGRWLVAATRETDTEGLTGGVSPVPVGSANPYT